MGLNTLATVRNYEVSRELSFDKLYTHLTRSAEDHGIVAWELTHSTLEEVFLNVVSQHWVNAIEAKKDQAARVGPGPSGDVALKAFSSPSPSSSSSSDSDPSGSDETANTGDDAHGSPPKTTGVVTSDPTGSYYSSSYVSEQ